MLTETHQAALRDPSYHRYLMFGQADEERAQQLGRPLLEHEQQSRLPWPQLEMVRRVEQAIADRAGEVITVRSARQSGKNEVEAFLECRALSIFRAIPGSTWVRMAPTYVPQLTNSKHRLEKHTRNDPLIGGRVQGRAGHIVQLGEAKVRFLSAGKHAQVIGETASIALSMDEGHKIDQAKYEEEISPFTASVNAPVLLWGVAADNLDLLQEYVDRNVEADRKVPHRRRRHLEYPAEVWCDLSPFYAAHYEGKVRALGVDHPVIKTQYRMIPVDALGGYLNDAQRRILFSGDHPRLSGPRDGMSYGLVVDLGGQSEIDAGDDQVRMEEPGRDYTMAWILEWDPAAIAEPYPDVRIVDGHWWVGREHMSVAPELVRTCKHWRIVSGAIDARGVGEAVAMFVSNHVPNVEAYKATDVSVSEDCYALLARLNCGLVKFWRADPAADEYRREMEAQARHTRYSIQGHDLMKLIKPTGAKTTNLHIDGMKALTYLHRAIQGEPGVMAFYRRRVALQKEGKT